MTASLLSEVDASRAHQVAREIGQRLRVERERLGESNKDAARELRVDPHTLTELERGTRPSISLPVALKALHRYGYTLRVVHEDAGDRANPSVVERIRVHAAAIAEAMRSL